MARAGLGPVVPRRRHRDLSSRSIRPLAGLATLTTSGGHADPDADRECSSKNGARPCHKPLDGRGEREDPLVGDTPSGVILLIPANPPRKERGKREAMNMLRSLSFEAKISISLAFRMVIVATKPRCDNSGP